MQRGRAGGRVESNSLLFRKIWGLYAVLAHKGGKRASCACACMLATLQANACACLLACMVLREAADGATHRIRGQLPRATVQEVGARPDALACESPQHTYTYLHTWPPPVKGSGGKRALNLGEERPSQVSTNEWVTREWAEC